MPRWNVLMTTEQYIEVKAANHAEAEMCAYRMYQRGEVVPESPIFVCEQADLIEESEDA